MPEVEERILSALKSLQEVNSSHPNLGLSERELAALIALPSTVQDLVGTVATLAARVEKNDRIVSGNGDPAKGLVIRFDRMEQTLTTLTRVIYALSTGTVLALIKLGVDALGSS